MWNDIETSEDFLNFTNIAKTISNLIIESKNKPISIGVSGSWGSGKSSLVRMIGNELREIDSTNKVEEKQFIFIEFNAWLYQGYDDARSALLHTVSNRLELEVNLRKKTDVLLNKIQNFKQRINWLQLAKFSIPLAISLLPGSSIGNGIFKLLTSIFSNGDMGDKDESMDINLSSKISTGISEVSQILREKESRSPTQQIEELRSNFAEILKDLNVTLVILVDDLDRCLPNTAISTLEAMRLLLFVENTAFIIAADEQMIRNSVKAHFSDLELSEGLITSYFDKLVQIPISVPQLGVAEVKIYLLSLFTGIEVEKGNINKDEWEVIKDELQKLLTNSWRGGVTKFDIENIYDKQGKQLEIQNYINISEQISTIMVTSNKILGNPRLIKRFLNNIVIRDKIARINGMSIEFSILVKMLLFERCATDSAFKYLSKKAIESSDGKLGFISSIEDDIKKGILDFKVDKEWDEPFTYEWLRLDPMISNIDIRPYLYLSKNKLSNVYGYEEMDRMTLEILDAMENIKRSIDDDIIKRIKLLNDNEIDKLLLKLSQNGVRNQWKKLDLLKILHIAKANDKFGDKVFTCIDSIPENLIEPSFIPLIKDFYWSKGLFDKWRDSTIVKQSTKNAIR